MEEVTDNYFYNIADVLKTYWIENMPFVDDREKHVFILLLIGNSSCCIARRLGLEINDVLFDRDNLFKKIQLLSGHDIISSVCNFKSHYERMEERKSEAIYCVYSLTFPDGKVYIGLTCDVNKRWSNGRGYKSNEPMHKAITECGWDNVNKEILYFDLPYKDARDKEKALIIERKSCDPEYGYNRTI